MSKGVPRRTTWADDTDSDEETVRGFGHESTAFISR